MQDSKDWAFPRIHFSLSCKEETTIEHNYKRYNNSSFFPIYFHPPLTRQKVNPLQSSPTTTTMDLFSDFTFQSATNGNHPQTRHHSSLDFDDIDLLSPTSSISSFSSRSTSPLSSCSSTSPSYFHHQSITSHPNPVSDLAFQLDDYSLQQDSPSSTTLPTATRPPTSSSISGSGYNRPSSSHSSSPSATSHHVDFTSVRSLRQCAIRRQCSATRLASISGLVEKLLKDNQGCYAAQSLSSLQGERHATPPSSHPEFRDNGTWSEDSDGEEEYGRVGERTRRGRGAVEKRTRMRTKKGGVRK